MVIQCYYHRSPKGCIILSLKPIPLLRLLVSDDEVDSENVGVTMPSNTDATHNASLSPLFLTRTGRRNNTSDTDNAITWRGNNGYFLTKNLYSNNRTHILQINQGNHVSPSAHGAHATNVIPFSLRCLVSTNNRIKVIRLVL